MHNAMHPVSLKIRFVIIAFCFFLSLIIFMWIVSVPKRLKMEAIYSSVPMMIAKNV